MPPDPSVSRLIGLGPYLSVREMNQDRTGANIEQVQKLQSLQEHFRGEARDKALRAELDTLPEDQRTPENYSQIAAKYAPSKDLYHYSQQAQDRAAQIQATKEMAGARLLQTAQSARQMYELRSRNLTRKEDKDALDKSYKGYMANLKAEATRYNVGSVIPDFETAQQSSSPPTQPSSAPMQPSSSAPVAPTPASAPEDVSGTAQEAPPQEAPPQEAQPVQVPPTTPATPTAAPATELPPMPSGIADAPRRIQDLWKLRVSTQGATSGLGGMLPDEKRFWADRVLTGGNPPSFGWGQQGSADRREFARLVAQRASEKGIAGGDSTANIAVFKSTTNAMSSLARLGAQVLSFEQTAIKNLDVAIGEASRFARVGMPIIDRAGNPIRQNLGDNDLPGLKMALITVQNEYAKISTSATAAGVAGTRADREEIGHLLGSELNLGQLKRVAFIMRKDMQNRRVAIREEQMSLRKEISGMLQPQGGKDESPATHPSTKSPREMTNAELIRRRGELRGGQ